MRYRRLLYNCTYIVFIKRIIRNDTVAVTNIIFHIDAERARQLCAPLRVQIQLRFDPEAVHARCVGIVVMIVAC